MGSKAGTAHLSLYLSMLTLLSCNWQPVTGLPMAERCPEHSPDTAFEYSCRCLQQVNCNKRRRAVTRKEFWLFAGCISPGTNVKPRLAKISSVCILSNVDIHHLHISISQRAMEQALIGGLVTHRQYVTINFLQG